MTYSPLGVGGLSGVYTPGQPPPAGTLTPPGAPENWAERPCERWHSFLVWRAMPVNENLTTHNE